MLRMGSSRTRHPSSQAAAEASFPYWQLTHEFTFHANRQLGHMGWFPRAMFFHGKHRLRAGIPMHGSSC